jgi:hypothetical protein
MLVLLVMEALNALIHKAKDWLLFKLLGAQAITHRASFYVDDLVWFVALDQRDLQMVQNILDVFEKASGLGCNMDKCQLAPIWCDPDQVAHASSKFPCSVVDFPIKYLGIPLSVSKLPKSALQPLLDQAVDQLPIWKGRLLDRCGRLTLIKMMFSSIPIYTSIIL